ncbi:MAG TPA: GntR family transcriptional regulator [Solirubrobacteraceae bacterium]|jgi:GntR family transcriptional repressor for pyruvate dehydrogenase complex
MALRAVTNASLPDKVFAQLAGEIVSGRYRPGTTLPSERTLSSVFTVNRHVVREALGRLEQLGLVRVVQGGGTTVLDYRLTAGLDLLAVLAEHADAGEGMLAPLGAALEMRAGIGIDVARLCARRATPEVRDALGATAERLAAVATGRELLAIDRLFWQQMVDGAANFAYQLAFNSLMRGVQAAPELSVSWLEHELAASDYRRPIAAAIAAGDPPAAGEATRAALEPAVAAMDALRPRIDAASAGPT